MGPPKKLNIVIDWLEELYNDQSILTRKFWQASELLSLFIESNPNIKMSLFGFKKFLFKISLDKLFPNLKIKITHPNNRRKVEYIILHTDEIDHIDIYSLKVSAVRRKRKNKEITPDREPCDTPSNKKPASNDTATLSVVDNTTTTTSVRPNDTTIADCNVNISFDTPTVACNASVSNAENECSDTSNTLNDFTTAVDHHEPNAQSTVSENVVTPTVATADTPTVAPAVTPIRNIQTGPAVMPVVATTTNLVDTTLHDVTACTITTVDNNVTVNIPVATNSITVNAIKAKKVTVNATKTRKVAVNAPKTRKVIVNAHTRASVVVSNQRLLDDPNSMVSRYMKLKMRNLDFEAYPRRNLFTSDSDVIELKGRKECDDWFKCYLINIATELGFSKMTYEDRLLVAEEMIKRESYIAGYRLPVMSSAYFNQYIWNVFKLEQRINPRNAPYVLMSQRGNKKGGYVEKINRTYPTLLHGLYRYAVQALGADETAQKLSEAMNVRSKDLFPDCPIRSKLTMTRHHFWKFFYTCGGKLKNPVTKPRLTPEHIRNRLVFAQKWLDKLKSGEKFYYCFLDEKWFYTSSRRKKFKILPKAPWEELKDAFFIAPKVRSRRHPCKVMFLSVVAPPIIDKDGNVEFDGKILMKRVSKTAEQARLSTNQNFVEYYVPNHKLKIGEWKLLYNNMISPSQLIQQIVSKYKIGDRVAEKLVFKYKSASIVTKKKTGKKVFGSVTKYITASDTSLLDGRFIQCPAEDGSMKLESRPLKLKDLNLHVQVPAKTLYQKDVSCDSDFMVSVVDEIGTSIRAKFSFVEKEKPIYLFMDNAGGHGKEIVKESYVKRLRDEYNVIVEWQVPYSPETNMLDLGVWVALQSHTEYLHKKKVMKPDVLSRSAVDAYKEIDAVVLDKVHERWKVVLELILAGKGSNNLVESHRGLKSNLADLPSVPDLDSDDDEVIEKLIKKAEDDDMEMGEGEVDNNAVPEPIGDKM